MAPSGRFTLITSGLDFGEQVKSTLDYWVKQHRKRNGSVSAVEEKDLRKRVMELEQENQRLTLEREILKKAAAFFARKQP